MKIYTKLPVPKDTAWERPSWRKYVHWRIKEFIDGMKNIFRWIPTIYKDRDWDDYYVLKILQKKIEYQRAYLIKHNRHMGIERDNFWMTVCLNLIEREINEYYACEYQDYEKVIYETVVSEETTGYELKFHTEWENYEEFLKKYRLTVHKNIKKFENCNMHRKAFKIAQLNQQKCRNLLFRILNEKLPEWWD